MTTETFQLSLAAAERYEAEFVPAIFAEWAPLLVDAAGVRPGHRVLDVACGTGVVARTAAGRLNGRGVAVGVDLNVAMLTIARRVRPDLEWRQGDVAALPFQDSSFDVVLCQMALMFFPDRVAALRELRRVVRAGGTVGLVVPSSLAAQPAYAPFVAIAARHAGPEATSALGAYWSCGDTAQLTGWLTAAGLELRSLRTHAGVARFAAPDDLVAVEINASPLAGRIDPEAYERIRRDTAVALAGFHSESGAFEPPLHAHVVVAQSAAV